MAAVPSHVLIASTRPREASSARARRIVLVVGTVLAVAVGLGVATVAPARVVDPDLVMLLRAMAAIKAVLVAAALGIVAWRVGLPTSPQVALAYTGSIAAMSFATALIWMSAFIGLAAVVFHVALFTTLIAAWRDDRVFSSLRSIR